VYILLRVGFAFEWWNIPSYSLEVITVNLAMMILFYGIALKFIGQHSNKFIFVYLLMTVIRMITLSAIIFVIIRLDKEEAVANAAFFLITYFFFMLIEVIELSKRIKV